jgi:diguanylate cyclase (GGDEF)-like protein
MNKMRKIKRKNGLKGKNGRMKGHLSDLISWNFNQMNGIKGGVNGNGNIKRSGALKNILKLFPLVGRVINELERENNDLRRILSYKSIGQNMISQGPHLNAQYDAIMTALKNGFDCDTVKILRIYERRGKKKITMMRGIGKDFKISRITDYPSEIDTNSGRLSSIVAATSKAYHVITRDNLTKLYAVETSAGRVSRVRSRILLKKEKKIAEKSRGKKNYEKYETPIFIGGRMTGIVIIGKEKDTLDRRERKENLIKNNDILELETTKQLIEILIEKAEIYEEKEKQAISDSLTGIYNKRYFDQKLAEDLDVAMRIWHNYFVSLLFLDVDFFKRINDRYGHQAGDKVLKEIAERIKANCRYEADIVARYGGEEFAVILPLTNYEAARKMAERIRESVMEKPFRISDDLEVTVTISCGVVDTKLTLDHIRANLSNPEYRRFDDAHEKLKHILKDKNVSKKEKSRRREGFFSKLPTMSKALIYCADKALYEAKGSGRNRVVLYVPKKKDFKSKH